VKVNKAWYDVLTGRVDGAGSLSTPQPANGRNPIANYSDISVEPWIARSVIHSSAGDQQIEALLRRLGSGFIAEAGDERHKGGEQNEGKCSGNPAGAHGDLEG
jgi:hypothetical protein